MNLKAIIPARKGSQRVLNKNIRPFAGSSLLEIKIKQLLRIDLINEVYVNSDCEQMLELAKNLGATAVKRDEHFASSTVPMNDVWKNLAENSDCDSILYTNATNPLVKDETYYNIIKTWGDLDEDHDSITTVHEIQEYMWNSDGPVNYDPRYHPRSQDLPKYFGLNFAVSIIPRSLMIDRKSIIGASFKPYFLDKKESLDIDDIRNV